VTIGNQTVLDAFFSAPNRLRAGTPAVAVFVDAAREGAPFAVLPSVQDDEGGTTIWYAAAVDPRAARGMREALDAALGPQLSHAPPAPTDRLVAVLEQAGLVDVRMILVPAELRDTARTRLARLVALAASTPTLSAVQQPTRRHLADLQAALNAGRYGDARAIVNLIREAGIVSSANVTFLEVRCQAAERAWTSIVARTDLDDIVFARPPRLVTEAILDAADAVYLSSATSADELLQAWDGGAGTRFAPLLTDISTATTPAAITAWAAHAATASLSHATIETLRERAAAVDGVPPAAQEVIDQLEEAASVSVRDLLDAGDFRGAWLILQRQSGRRFDAASFEAMALCAIELQDPAITSAMLEQLDGATAAEPLPRRLQILIDQLRRDTSSPSASADGWDDWIETLARGVDVEPLVRHGQDNAPTWVATSLTTAGATRLARVLADGRDDLVEAVSDLRPWLVVALSDAAIPRSVRRRVGLALVDCIALGPRHGRDEAVDLLRCLEMLVDDGLSDTEAGAVADAISLVGTRLAAGRSIGWAIDLLDAATTLHTPEALAAGSAIVDALGRQRELLLDIERAAIVDAAERLGLAVEAIERQTARASEVDDAHWEFLSGKRVFVYTLDERAAARARTEIERRCPTARISTSSAHVADDRLRADVRACDVAIIATRVAKHAATAAIDAELRGRIEPTYPDGGGWTSIVRAALTAAKTLDQR
jgi:hypothetical protein